METEGSVPCWQKLILSWAFCSIYNMVLLMMMILIRIIGLMITINTQVEVLCDVMCSVAVEYPRLGVLCCLHLQGLQGVTTQKTSPSKPQI